MNETPLISIIVPVYNTERFLRQCLTSICSQTYHNIEIIIVNDGSKDGSASICEEFAHKDNRIILIHQENKGLSSTRNLSLKIAHGEFFMFVDSDDWVEPDFCQSALDCIKKNNVRLAVFGYEKFDDKGFRKKYNIEKPQFMDSSEAMYYLLSNKYIYNLEWNKIYGREIFNNIEFPIGRLYQDYPIACKLIHNAGRIYVTDKLLYHYRRQESSSTFRWYRPKNIMDRFQLSEQRLLFLKENYPNLVDLQIKLLSNEAVYALAYNRGEEYKDFRNEVKAFLRSNKQIILNNCDNPYIKLYYRCGFLMPILFRIRKRIRI